MSKQTSFDIAFEIFARIYDFIPRETVDGLKQAMQMNGAHEFSMKHGPANYAHWSRDIQVIEDVIDVLGVTEYAPS